MHCKTTNEYFQFNDPQRQGALLNSLHQDPRWQAYLEHLGISDAQLANIRLEVNLPN